MRERILHQLQMIEQEKNVRIIYACESGSRAWGMASENSDYDVRFIYVRPKQMYLRLDEPRDVIELPIVDELDVNGWDIFKALRLLRKSNPALIEWLMSPIVYREDSVYVEKLREFVREHFAAPALFYHYSRMGYGNYHQYIEGKEQASLKKYLYVLRPIIVLLYLEQTKKLPPTNFVSVLDQVSMDGEVWARIEKLIIEKRAGAELGLGPSDTVLNAFIEEHLGRWKRDDFAEDTRQGLNEELNAVLVGILDEQVTV